MKDTCIHRRIHPCVPQLIVLYYTLAVEVSLMSPGWLVTNYRERVASIMVNGKEMARDKFGMNIVVFNYLSGTFNNCLAVLNLFILNDFISFTYSSATFLVAQQRSNPLFAQCDHRRKSKLKLI